MAGAVLSFGISDDYTSKWSGECNERYHYKPEFWYVHGKAYDFTPFISRHPGGSFAITQAMGMDATMLFESYHLKMPARALLEKYRVPKEDIKDYVEKYTYGKYRGLLDHVQKVYFEKKGYVRTGGFFNLLTSLCLVVIFLGCWRETCLNGNLIAAAIAGVTKSLLVVRPTHACSHYALTTSIWFNQFYYWLLMCCAGDTPAQWTTKHVMAHHIDTNINGIDDDTMYPIKRTLPDFQRYWFHTFQVVYIWLMYLNVYIPWSTSHTLKVLLHMVRGGGVWEGNRQVRLVSCYDWFETLSAEVFHWIFKAQLFLYMKTADGERDWPKILWALAAHEIAGSLWFSLQFAVNHETHAAVEYSGKPEQVWGEQRDWGHHQIVTSSNYSSDGILALHLSGGLNTQIEHHLYPSVHYSHYRELSKITRKYCKRNQIPYNDYKTFFHALADHMLLLVETGWTDEFKRKQLAKKMLSGRRDPDEQKVAGSGA